MKHVFTLTKLCNMICFNKLCAQMNSNIKRFIEKGGNEIMFISDVEDLLKIISKDVKLYTN